MPTEGGSQLKVMEAGVNANAAKYNEIKLTAERKTLELKERLTTLDSLRVEVGSFSPHSPQHGGKSNKGLLQLLRAAMDTDP